MARSLDDDGPDAVLDASDAVEGDADGVGEGRGVSAPLEPPRDPEGEVAGPQPPVEIHVAVGEDVAPAPLEAPAAPLSNEARQAGWDKDLDGPRVEAPPPEEDPFAGLWFFDNPSLGRALRYTFGEKRLARAVFVNGLLLVVCLAVIQELFGRAQLGLYSETVSYGRLAFLGIVGIEALLVSILAPLGFVNLFEAERREECFDQVIVSGASPHQVVFGRLVAVLAFLAVVLFSALPFFATTVVFDGASVGQVLQTYAVLVAYAVCIASIAAATSVGFDDTALPVVIGVLAGMVVLVAGFTTSNGSPELAAWSPLRHVVVSMNDIAQGLRLADYQPPTPFGLELGTATVSLAFYGVLSLLGLGYAFVGPDLELSRGLDAFDSVATSLRSEATRARRGVARTLLRTVQVRFFYENLGPRAQAAAPLIRAAITAGLFVGLHVVILGALWPEQTPKAWGVIDNKVAYPYLGFSMLSLGLMALAASGSRSALLARAPVRVGPLRVSRFGALFLLFGVALVAPPALWTAAAKATGAADAMLDPRGAQLYGLIAGYASFMFGIALLFAMRTTNPYSAMGWTLLVLFACNLIPVMWIPLYRGNVLGPGSATFMFDLSPLVAAFDLARPEDTLPFSRFEDDQPVPYDHDPSWIPFAAFHLLVGGACLVYGLWLSRGQRGEQLAGLEEVPHEA